MKKKETGTTFGDFSFDSFVYCAHDLYFSKHFFIHIFHTIR